MSFHLTRVRAWKECSLSRLIQSLRESLLKAYERLESKRQAVLRIPRNRMQRDVIRRSSIDEQLLPDPMSSFPHVDMSNGTSAHCFEAASVQHPTYPCVNMLTGDEMNTWTGAQNSALACPRVHASTFAQRHMST